MRELFLLSFFLGGMYVSDECAEVLFLMRVRGSAANGAAGAARG